MIRRRLVVLCAACLLQVLSIAESSGNVTEENIVKSIETSTGNVPEEKIVGNSDGTIKMDESFETNFEFPWFAKVPILPIVYATSPSLPEGPCKKQAQRYLRELKNGTLWASQMYDASAKYPDGLISGLTMHLGDFDGCYNLKARLPRNKDDAIDEEINGRYCLVDIDYRKRGLPPVDPNQRHELVFDPNDSFWEAIRDKGDTRRWNRNHLRMALCVPEVCSHEDIEAALQQPLKKFGTQQNFDLNISVKAHFCQAQKDAPKMSQAGKIYCWLVAGLIALVLISTIYDVKSTRKDEKEKTASFAKHLLLCFSARRNFNTLVEPTTSYRGLQTVHLIRFVWMTLTTIGHRAIQYWVGPLINPNYIEWFHTIQTSMIVFAGPHLVEGFFGLGGMLLSYSLLGELDAKKKMNFFAVMFLRFLRLTPSYMIVVFFCALVLPHLGSGPLWEWKIGGERDSCTNNWWTHLFYVNNYVNPDKTCLFQSWYLSADYHLFAIALLVTYMFWRMPRKYGYLFLCVIIVGGAMVPFINTYVYGVQPLYIGYLSLEEVRDDPYFTQHYGKTHERLSSYFVGVLVGAVIYDHSRAPWYLGKVSSHIAFFFMVVVLSLGSQLTGHKYLDPNANPSRLDAALYAALYRGAFALSTVAMPLLITVGTGLTFHTNFLTPQWSQPFARLTYGAYLVHSIFQLYDTAVTRTPRSFALHNTFVDYVPDIFFTFCVSFVLAMVVEGPFRRLSKLLFMKRSKSGQSNGTELKNEAIKKTN